MTKKEAIKWTKDIQNGLYDRNEIDVPKGRIAKSIWNNKKFAYGMEYGAITAVMKIFNLKKL